MNSSQRHAFILSVLFSLACLFRPPAAFGEGYPPVDVNREAQRALSALNVQTPQITSLEIDGEVAWTVGQTTPVTVHPGQWVRLVGRGFGAGPDIDYAKVLVGNSRALERDVILYQGAVDLLRRLFFERPESFDSWKNDIREWKETSIEFRIPVTATRGPIVVQVQKRTGHNPSLLDPAIPHTVWDPMTERIPAGKIHRDSDVISVLGAPMTSAPVPVLVVNSDFADLRAAGEAAFWSFDYNIGLTHHMNKMDWPTVLAGKAIDPVTGRRGDPWTLFGAIPAHEGEVPSVVTQPFYFDPYPSPMPIKPLLRQPLYSGWARPTGFVGYSVVESVHPITQLKGAWIGFSCASCHAQRITYEAAPGQTVTKVFPGLPNNQWSMKWNVLGGMKGIRGRETGLDGKSAVVDKTQIVYAVPPGTGEASLVRSADDGSAYANDSLFSPIAIPIITRHTPVRRALSRSELIIGFEGSYAHAEEPDGGIGALWSHSLQALTAYMTTLDQDDVTLTRVGLYRYLQRNHALAEVNGASEGEFVQKGWAAFPQLQARLDRGKQAFGRACLSCHQSNFNTWTDESMIPLDKVGTYFSPTIFQLQTQSIRTSILRDLYWVEGRGLLHDGHVKSLEDLVDPERCREGSTLYNRYYTMHQGSFHIPKGNAEEERALRRHAWFTDVSWDHDNLYWDYQSMRHQFGPRELGSPAARPLPAAPHPWCATDASEVADMVRFLLTL